MIFPNKSEILKSFRGKYLIEINESFPSMIIAVVKSFYPREFQAFNFSF